MTFDVLAILLKVGGGPAKFSNNGKAYLNNLNFLVSWLSMNFRHACEKSAFIRSGFKGNKQMSKTDHFFFGPISLGRVIKIGHTCDREMVIEICKHYSKELRCRF